jgi:hypothetical protein
MGFMQLGKNYSTEIMESASREALDKNTCSYKYFGMILKQVAAMVSKTTPEKMIHHDNIRGSSAFTGGGINA